MQSEPPRFDSIVPKAPPPLPYTKRATDNDNDNDNVNTVLYSNMHKPIKTTTKMSTQQDAVTAATTTTTTTCSRDANRSRRRRRRRRLSAGAAPSLTTLMLLLVLLANVGVANSQFDACESTRSEMELCHNTNGVSLFNSKGCQQCSISALRAAENVTSPDCDGIQAAVCQAMLDCGRRYRCDSEASGCVDEWNGYVAACPYDATTENGACELDTCAGSSSGGGGGGGGASGGGSGSSSASAFVSSRLLRTAAATALGAMFAAGYFPVVFSDVLLQ